MPEVEPYELGAPCWMDLASPDPEAAKAFYRGLLGWDSYTYAQYLLADYTHFTLPAGGAETAGLIALNDDSMRAVWTAYFTVADIVTAGERVLAAGGRVHVEPVDAAHLGRLSICSDTQRIGFGLWQPYDFHGSLWQAGPGTLHWLELACPDPGSAQRFYGDVFGWKCGDVTPGDGSLVECGLAGSAFADLTSDCHGFPPGWLPHFAVADCAAAVTRATGLGAALVVPPTESRQGRFAVVSDPAAAPLALLQPVCRRNRPG